MSDAPHVSANIERWFGVASVYDRSRPSPPKALTPILTQVARLTCPQCVVDIGSGTGLSTRIWAEAADQVIGVEPNDEMRQMAEASSAGLANVRYQKGLSIATGLPDVSADIVTVSQALHWMEPTDTFVEIARILRPGGVFAAIDNDFPPTINWEAEMAGNAFKAKIRALVRAHLSNKDVRQWEKDGHLSRMEASGQFRYTNEIALSSMEMGNADRMVNMELSRSPLQELIKVGLSEDEIGIPALRAEMQRILGDTTLPMYFTYRVRIGVK
jgi:SAM-dependent methyltransferase